jgi:hypothetical protein
LTSPPTSLHLSLTLSYLSLTLSYEERGKVSLWDYLLIERGKVSLWDYYLMERVVKKLLFPFRGRLVGVKKLVASSF